MTEYLTMNVDDAFKLLRNYARDHNRKLSEVASNIVDRKISRAELTNRPGPHLIGLRLGVRIQVQPAPAVAGRAPPAGSSSLTRGRHRENVYLFCEHRS